ncbi:hypothetical protein HDU87_005872 [Geranomyces variabilis]|uniref:Uncharacterized protein n=1 Tax=Geranomyces variabilis TaxID=109894 RepID=A0AAD5TQ11_9FUNG|nr:hypothetical protein HDU87_005872 [Geranomyces variabilis]
MATATPTHSPRQLQPQQTPPSSPSPSSPSPTASSTFRSLSSAATTLPPSLACLPHLPAYLFARHGIARADARALLTPEVLWSTHLGLAGALGGFVSSFYLAGRTRSFQFLAENAHRLPKTVAGWYFYHRYKNYEIAHAGFVGGMKGAARFGAICAGFGAAEALVESAIGRESWVATVGAGLLTTGAFSLTSGLTRQYAKYALLFGAGASLLIGALEDGYAWQTGQSVKYDGHKRMDAFWIPGFGSLRTKVPVAEPNDEE